MEFRILGPLEVRADGEELTPKGPKQRALLAILLLNAGDVVSSDRLIDELWGGEAPSTAAKSLQVHVSQLRKTLGRAAGQANGIVQTRAPGYVLGLEAAELDLRSFEALLEEGRTRLADEPAAAARSLRGALGLWRGDPLSDVPDSPLVEAEARRLLELRLTAREDLMDAELASGRHSELIAELEQLIETEPLRERLRGQLMLALYRAGRQAEALEAYRSARAMLVGELGIEPGEPLQELHTAILAQDASLRAPAAPTNASVAGERRDAPAEPEHRDGGAFVGREQELRDLELALAGLSQGRGATFLIGGEPGIGKSRLVDEFGRRASSSGALVLSGRCWEAGGAPAFWPWVQALRGYVQATEPELLRRRLGPRGGEVAHLLPELRESIPDLPVLESPDSDDARFRLFEAATAFLTGISEESPVVLTLEDLHSADTPSLLLLQFLAGEISGSRMLVLGTYRDIELTPEHQLSQSITELNRIGSTRTLALAGLPERHAARLIEVHARRTPPPRAVTAIHRATEGNPLFIGELARLLAAEGRLDDPVDAAELKRALPHGILEVLQRRLSRVSDQGRDLLRVGSALGREFSAEVLGVVRGQDPTDVLAALDEAIEQGLVGDPPARADRLRFSHVLIRDALYDELGRAERMRLHAEIGHALERLYGDEPEAHLAQLAQQFFEAGPEGDPEKAHDYARRAGDRARALLAYEEAARLYVMAIRVVTRLPGARKEDRCELLLRLGDALIRAGDEEAAKEAFWETAELARELGLPEALGRAALGYGGRWTWMAARGDPRVIPLLEDSLDRLEPGDRAIRAQLMARLACAIRDQPFRERRLSLTAESVEMARRVGDLGTLVYALDARCIVIAGPDTVQELEEASEELARLAPEVGSKELTLVSQVYRHFHSLRQGRLEHARDELAAAERLADEMREPGYRWYPLSVVTAMALFEGRFSDAAELIGQTYETGRRAAPFNAEASYQLQRMVLQLETGDPHFRTEDLLNLIEESKTYTILRSGLARHRAANGDAAAARAIFEELASDDFAGVYLDESWPGSITFIADTCVALGDETRAATLYELILPHAELNAIGYPEVVLGSMSRPLGELAALLGERADAESHLRHAIEANREWGGEPSVAHSQFALARALRDTDSNSTEARELLSSAAEAYARLGMSPWAARTRQELD